jgi:hypothetical protein
MYLPSLCDDEVDLDNSATYEHLPNDCKLLEDIMFKEIGFAICYMDIIHRNIFHSSMGKHQRKRVMKMIRNFCKERHNNYENEMWLKEQIFLFQDEIDNMC